jgi:hypothetical protein
MTTTPLPLAEPPRPTAGHPATATVKITNPT